jgi:serine/threonine protein kinase
VPWTSITFSEDAILGSGSFGVICRGTAKQIDKKGEKEIPVAVKVLKAQSSKVSKSTLILGGSQMSSCYQKLFIREIETLSRIDHPCCARFFSYNIMGGYAYAMELLHISLHDVLSYASRGTPYCYSKPDGTRIEWNDTRRSIVAFGIAAGMCHLHDRKVIHRDLKSLNVMLDDDLFPRITDFGLSKVMEYGPSVVRNITMTGGQGTELYMAPEMFNEASNYTTAVDVYAYGSVFYEIITGDLPWHENGNPCYELREIWKRVLEGQTPPIPNYVNAQHKSLLEACWERDPERRPTFRQMVAFDPMFWEFNDVGTDEFLDYREKMIALLDNAE